MTLIFLILIAIGYCLGLYFWFEKAGEKGWKAFVPYLRIATWVKLTNKPKSFIFWSFVPVVNLFIYANLLGETSDTYKRYSFWEHALATAFGFVWLPFLGLNKNEKYYGPEGTADGGKKPAKSIVREWTDAIIFAIFAAYFIRTFVFEIYMIPTSSMEGTLRVGEFLVVSKFHYGSRVPNTPIAFPLVHHSFPKFLGGGKSYLEWIKLPYNRLPKFESVNRNDMVVFNFPANDTTTKEFDSANPYYDIVRTYQNIFGLSENDAKDKVKNGFGSGFKPEIYRIFEMNLGIKKSTEVITNGFTILTRPVDKRENYIKRCVAIAGDTLEIKSGNLLINNEPAYNPENIQFRYKVVGKDKPIPPFTFSEIDSTALANVKGFEF
jgi:signal peptidase I